MRRRIRLLGLVPVAMLAGCAPQEAPETTEAPSTPMLDAQTLPVQLDHFVSAWNTGDMASAGSMIAEDAVLMQPDGPPLMGRDAIVGTISQGYDITMFQQSATVDETLALGEYAYARGTWTLNPTTEAGESVPSMNGKWSAVYTAGPDGGWQVWRWMWNQPSGQGVPSAE
jgi:ketosteroid isomerase-like protein